MQSDKSYNIIHDEVAIITVEMMTELEEFMDKRYHPERWKLKQIEKAIKSLGIFYA